MGTTEDKEQKETGRMKYKETDEILKNVTLYLKAQFKEIKPEWKQLLKTLGNLYDTYFLAQETIDTAGITVQTSRGIIAHPAIKIQNDTLIRIEKTLDMLAVSPKAQLKLRLVEKGENEDDFIDSLMGKK